VGGKPGSAAIVDPRFIARVRKKLALDQRQAVDGWSWASRRKSTRFRLSRFPRVTGFAIIRNPLSPQ
jgi:hypothetical protein